MNLQEILAEMRAHPSCIMVEELVDEDHGTYLFVRVTWLIDKGNHVANQQSVCLVVSDRDGPKEQAFYKGSRPLPPLADFAKV